MIESHDLRDLRSPVECLAFTTKQDLFDAEKDPNSEISKALLRGDISLKRGTTIAWLDTECRMHSVRVEYGEQMPVFKIVKKPGLAVEATGFATFSWTGTNEDANHCRAV